MKKRVLNLLLIVLFCGMLVIPLLFADFQGGKISQAEQRVLAEFPSLFPVSAFRPADIEAWINDNIGGRALASAAVTRANYDLWRYSEKQDVYIGREDWIYYATRPILEDYIGNNLIPEADLQVHLDRLERLQGFLEERSVAFSAYLVPDKKTVYPEYYMRGVMPITETSRSDQLTAYIREHSDLDFHFLKKALTEAKESGRFVYSPRVDEAHWNSYGAYVGYQYILKNTESKISGIRGFRPEDVRIQERLSEGIFFGAVPVQEIDYTVVLGQEGSFFDDSDYLDAFDNLTFASNPGAYKRRYLNQDSSLPKLLLIGDSYSLSLLGYLGQSFSEVTFLHILDLGQMLPVLEKTQPDLVIFEFVERMLPDALHGLWQLEQELP